jgi:hypothetical protein
MCYLKPRPIPGARKIYTALHNKVNQYIALQNLP